MPRRERAAPRKLVRWDNDTDILCLLAIPRIMARRGIKFPWGEVAAYVAPGVSGNALLQHLAKLERKRVEQGLPIPENKEPVGDMKQFGLMAAAGFGDKRNAQGEKKSVGRGRDDESDVDVDEDISVPPKKVTRKKSAKPSAPRANIVKPQTRNPKPSAIKAEFETEDDDDVIEVPKKTPFRANKPRKVANRARIVPHKQDDSDEWHFSDNDSSPEFRPSAKKIKVEPKTTIQLSRISPTFEPALPEKPAKVSVFKFFSRQTEFANRVNNWQAQDVSQDIAGSGQFDRDLEVSNLNLGLNSPAYSNSFAGLHHDFFGHHFENDFEQLPNVEDMLKPEPMFADTDAGFQHNFQQPRQLAPTHTEPFSIFEDNVPQSRQLALSYGEPGLDFKHTIEQPRATNYQARQTFGDFRNFEDSDGDVGHDGLSAIDHMMDGVRHDQQGGDMDAF